MRNIQVNKCTSGYTVTLTMQDGSIEIHGCSTENDTIEVVTDMMIQKHEPEFDEDEARKLDWQFRLDDRVQCEKFGTGTVTAVFPTADEFSVLNVKFDDDIVPRTYSADGYYTMRTERGTHDLKFAD